MTIAVGDKLPSLTLKERTPDGPADIDTDAMFLGRRVVLFAVPGAFTPTCSINHVPGFIENRDAILSKGISDIFVVSVNDHHVMGAWAKSTGGEGKLRFIADWNAAFTKALGLDIDLSAGTLGVRSKRYALIADNGVVTHIGLEENPGQATVSAAAAILEAL